MPKRRESREKRKTKIVLLFVLFGLSCASRMPPPGKPDIDPPRISILEPKNGDTVSRVLKIKYEYRDKSPLSWMGIYLDSKMVFSDSLERDSVLLKVDSLMDTVHSLYIEAKDKWDNKARSNHVEFYTIGGKRRKGKDEGVDREHKKSQRKSR